MEKKVMLDITARDYSSFQKCCKNNALPLFKKIGLGMGELAQKKTPNLVLKLLVVGLLFFSFVHAAVFNDNSAVSFNNGTHVNTTFNGSGVILVNGTTSGQFTSRVFDAGAEASWQNISWEGIEPLIEFLYVVDASSSVFSSANSGVNWTTRTSDYGDGGGNTASLFSNSDYLFILFSGSKKRVYRSSDLGATWSLVNDSFANSGLMVGASDGNGYLYVADGSGDVYQSTDHGVSWTLQGDFNGGSGNNAKGMAINSSNAIYVVDGSGAVYVSVDSGLNWTEQTNDYGGGSGTDGMIVTNSGDLYILFNKDIYRTTDEGSNWNLINDSFTPYSQDGLKISIDNSERHYITDSHGRVFQSTDSGISWNEISDFNGANTNNAKGFRTYEQHSNFSIYTRNCSLSDCSDGVFVKTNEGELNYSSRYFQYRAAFTSPESGTTSILENASVLYELLNTAPIVALALPKNDDTYGINESLPLNFSVIDNQGNLDNCWYNIDEGTNESIAGCENTTFDVSEGDHTLYLYANDTQGMVGSDHANFSVAVGSPSISLSSPINEYLNTSDVIFTYTATDIDLDSCQLWGDFSGLWGLNQTNSTVISGQQSSFALDLNDNTYKWNVFCNDTIGNGVFNGNKTFYVDTVVPGITISEPTGTKTSLENIPLTFSINDNSPVSCRYSVFQGASPDIGNTSIDCSAGTVLFNVSTIGNFELYLFANDSAGHRNQSSIGFTVNTVIIPPPSGGSGGGGGGSGGGGGGFIIPPAEVEERVEAQIISELRALVKRGEGFSREIEIENTGTTFLNNCSLSFSGEGSTWLISQDVLGISPGERAAYNVRGTVANDALPDEYDVSTSLRCDEGVATGAFLLSVYRNAFEITVQEYERFDQELRVTYRLEEFSGDNHAITMTYKMTDLDGVPRLEREEKISLNALDSETRELVIELPKDSFGEFVLELTLNDGVSQVTVTEDIFLPSGGLTGLAISGDNARTLSVFGVIVVAFLIVLGVLRFVVRHKKHKKTKETFGRARRKSWRLHTHS